MYVYVICVFMYMSVFLKGVFVLRPHVTVSSWNTVPMDNSMRFCESWQENHTRLLVDWSTGIASGMNYLYLHKIIHRDLKSPK